MTGLERGGGTMPPSASYLLSFDPLGELLPSCPNQYCALKAGYQRELAGARSLRKSQRPRLPRKPKLVARKGGARITDAHREMQHWHPHPTRDPWLRLVEAFEAQQHVGGHAGSTSDHWSHPKPMSTSAATNTSKYSVGVMLSERLPAKWCASSVGTKKSLMMKKLGIESEAECAPWGPEGRHR